MSHTTPHQKATIKADSTAFLQKEPIWQNIPSSPSTGQLYTKALYECSQEVPQMTKRFMFALAALIALTASTEAHAQAKQGPCQSEPEKECCYYPSEHPRVPGQDCPPAPAPVAKRLKNLCGISMYCSTNMSSGILLLPSASIGLVQIPFEKKTPGKPSYRDGFGDFRPSVGVTPRYWFLDGWFDAHFQLMYGAAAPTEGVTIKQDDYVWGATIGAGLIFSVINVDIGLFNRRQRTDSENVDTGGAILINFDITSAGVLLGTSASP
ncbi:hypothetical protein [Sorangium sp. So ce542]|uniref:hypothetical protein n=1 Tax=Sorangium sp. So ce542 TaxID=3133316 RepID=UPI003F60B532